MTPDDEQWLEQFLRETPRRRQAILYKALHATGLRIGVSLDTEIERLSRAAAETAVPEDGRWLDECIRATCVMADDVPRLWREIGAAAFMNVERTCYVALSMAVGQPLPPPVPLPLRGYPMIPAPLSGYVGMSDSKNSGSYDVNMDVPVESIREYDIMRLGRDYWEIWSRESRDDNIGIDTEQLRQLAAALQRIVDHL